MKRRWIVLLVTTSLLVLGSGFALGADRSEPPREMKTVSQVAAACDAMHRQMTQMMGQMDGSGTMGSA